MRILFAPPAPSSLLSMGIGAKPSFLCVFRGIPALCFKASTEVMHFHWRDAAKSRRISAARKGSWCNYGLVGIGRA
jgi:hypothetical protein